MCRRPMLHATIGIVVAILIGYYIGIFVDIFVIAILICAMIITQNTHQRRPSRLLFIIAFSIGLFCFYMAATSFEEQSSKMISKGNETRSIEGIVTDCETRKNFSGEKYLQITIRTNNGNLLVKKYFNNSNNQWKDEIKEDEEINQLIVSVIPGATISAKGKVQTPPGRRNPRCFDYELYLKSLGIVATMTADTIYVKPSQPTILGELYLLKENFIKRILKQTNIETATTLKAIMFGDKGLLDEDLLEVFQKNGTAHILAVSGLHIGIIYAFILKIWTLIGALTGGVVCGRKGWSFFLFVIGFFFCYMVFAGFSPSVVRAVFMVILHVFSQITNQRYDLNNAAFLVVLCVLIRNPFMLFNVSFQMSFLAVLTMMLVVPFVKNIYSGIFLTSLVVQIGVGPFIIYNFNYLSIATVFINVPVIILAGLIVPLGLVAMVFEQTQLFDIVCWPIDILCRALKWINEVTEIEGATTFQVASPPLWLLVFYYLSFLLLVTEEGRLSVIRSGKTIALRIKYIIKVFLVILTLTVIFVAFAGKDLRNYDLTFVDVGQGDCMHIKTDGGLLSGEKNYLIDGGGSVNYNLGKKTLKPYLLKNGVSRVDGAFVTHLHSDHYNGICQLAKEGMVKELFVYAGNEKIERKICKDTGLMPEQIRYLKAGDIVTLSKGKAYVQVLWPKKKTASEYEKLLADHENENDSSLVLNVVIKGASLLVTGDIDSELMDEMAEANIVADCDILKVPHHGSKYSISDEFIEAASAEYAVIQVGKNTYGHPAPETIEEYEKWLKNNRNDIEAKGIYRNDQCGAIGFQIKEGQIQKVKSMLP